MRNYKSFIRKCIKRKYKEIAIYDKKFLKKFLLQRQIFKKQIYKKNFVVNIFRDKTFIELKKIFYLKNKKNSQKKIFEYYKKFEINLSIKKKYDKFWKKQSNKETNINSYILLGLLINKCVLLNKFQKINCILKIIDKLILHSLNKEIILQTQLKKLLTVEERILKNIINEKISNYYK